MEILAVRNLSFAYPGSETQTLTDVTFSVEKGDFLLVCGATGSGKSTLMRVLKRELRPLGELCGEILYRGRPVEGMSLPESAQKIGFVMQRPEQQIVTDKVWHELAFGLENLGVPTAVIRRRVAEMAAYFGIEDWFDKSVAELSGGQKQLLNLASVMVMQPEILILDEPTAQLDPIAAADFIAALSKLNRELSLTVVIVEHRLEDAAPAANRLLALENGRVCAFGETKKALSALAGNESLAGGMPAAVRLGMRLGAGENCPLTVRDGRIFIENTFSNRIRAVKRNETPAGGEKALEFRDVFFRYGRELPDVLRGLSFEVYAGEIFCILGGNGSGKSTALACAAGLKRAYSGSIRVFGKKIGKYQGRSLYCGCLAMLPQDVQTVFLKNTVREELRDAGITPEELPFSTEAFLDRHPYDLSGGQQQLAAMAKVLGTKPRLLLLDEPTKGLDAAAKAKIIGILKTLAAGGAAVAVVTHDVEFAAECADRCAMFFRGEITSVSAPYSFFAENSFYTTAASRMTRGYYDNAVTVDEAERLCLLNGRKKA